MLALNYRILFVLFKKPAPPWYFMHASLPDETPYSGIFCTMLAAWSLTRQYKIPSNSERLLGIFCIYFICRFLPGNTKLIWASKGLRAIFHIYVMLRFTGISFWSNVMFAWEFWGFYLGFKALGNVSHFNFTNDSHSERVLINLNYFYIDA